MHTCPCSKVENVIVIHSSQFHQNHIILVLHHVGLMLKYLGVKFLIFTLSISFLRSISLLVFSNNSETKIYNY
jgi:hypothetical protein